jgi:uncharacterized protein YbjT (DUF2867 family)
VSEYQLLPRSRVDFSITSVQDNFSKAHELQQTAIKNDSKIYSAAGDGKIPFISAKDIARVAIKCLTNESLQAEEHLLLGPKLHTYDEVRVSFRPFKSKRNT